MNKAQHEELLRSIEASHPETILHTELCALGTADILVSWHRIYGLQDDSEDNRRDRWQAARFQEFDQWEAVQSVTLVGSWSADQLLLLKEVLRPIVKVKYRFATPETILDTLGYCESVIGLDFQNCLVHDLTLPAMKHLRGVSLDSCTGLLQWEMPKPSFSLFMKGQALSVADAFRRSPNWSMNFVDCHLVASTEVTEQTKQQLAYVRDCQVDGDALHELRFDSILFSGCKFKGELCTAMLPLKVIDIECCEFEDSWDLSELLRMLPAVEHLVIAYQSINLKVVKVLNSLTNLKRLDISDAFCTRSIRHLDWERLEELGATPKQRAMLGPSSRS